MGRVDRKEEGWGGVGCNREGKSGGDQQGRKGSGSGEGDLGGESWAKSGYRCANLSTNLDPSIYQENTKSDPSIYQFLWLYICLFNIIEEQYSSNNTYLKQLPKFINVEYMVNLTKLSAQVCLSLKTCLHIWSIR